MRNLILGFALTGISAPAMSWEATSKDDGCLLSTWLYDGTGVLVSQDEEDFDQDQVYILFTNPNWSIAEGDQLERIRVESDGGVWFEDQPFAADNAIILKTSYMTVSKMFEAKPPSEWRLSKGGELVTRIGLDDASYFAWTSFKTCRAKWMIAPERIERSLPSADPFSKEAED